MATASTGTVTQWFADEGWGVVESVDTPGGCWVHFSHVLGEGDMLRGLTVGETVSFTWESAEQDGYRYRAVSVGSGRFTAPASGPSGACSSRLTVSHGDESPGR